MYKNPPAWKTEMRVSGNIYYTRKLREESFHAGYRAGKKTGNTHGSGVPGTYQYERGGSLIVGAAILAFFTGMIEGVGVTCLMQSKNMTTKLQIISRLWSHITDLRLILNGTSSKTIEEGEERD